MDTDAIERATRFLNNLAAKHNLAVTRTNATFDDGTQGVQITLMNPGNPDAYGGTAMISYYNDDEFGARYIGKAGARVPGHRVYAYVAALVENPRRHPSDLNLAVLGR